MALALKMGPAEYFMIGVLALSLLSMASEGSVVKGLILGGFGLLLSYIGRDPITAIERFTFGSMFLEDGLPLAAVFVGLFAVPQVVILAEQGGSVAEVIEAKGGIWRGVREVLRYPVTVIRSGLMGIYMGVMPALGISAGSVLAYLVEKRASKDPESFGKGNVRGLLAPEVAKNACLVGDLIPTFTLGIPGSGVTAIFMAALILHGVQPGQDFFSKGALPYTVFAGILLAQFSFFVLGLFFAGNLAKVVRIPNAILVPIVVVLCCIGSYSIRGFMIDVTIMIIMGVIGYCLVKTKWPLPCFVLGFVLGNILEANFQRALLIGRGSLMPFVTRPGSLIILIITVGLFVWPYIKPMFFRQKKRDVEAEKLLETLDEDENR
jgi:putative tricarboxylic transport membrane protein